MIAKEQCSGCGLCVHLCPSGKMRMAADGEGFDYPARDGADCGGCRQCALPCPARTEESPAPGGNRYLGVRSLSRPDRERSSSGGFFPALADYVLRQGGVVFGAAFDENFVLRHRAARSPAELAGMIGSKYIQSRQDAVWPALKDALAAGQWALYTGTPCQCEAVRRYAARLGLPADRLILMDLVCYGTPSPGVWRDYVRYLEKKHGGRLTDYRFRDKSQGDHGRFVRYEIGGRVYTSPLLADLYNALYFSNYIIRPSCHHCPFTTVDRRSDLTVGDFWGIEHVRPDFDDGMGVSMVILRSEKAERLWSAIASQFAWFACGERDVLQKEQPRLRTPTAPAPRRRIFYFLYRRLPFSLLAALMWNGKRLRRLWR